MTIKVQLKREVNGVMQQVNPITSEECVILSDGKKLNEVIDFATTAEDFVDETIVIEENLVDRVESIENRIDSEFEQQNSQIATGLSNIKTVEQNISNKVDTEVAKVNAQLSQKANKNEVFSMANMGQDIREAMTGGSVAVIGKDSVIADNIVDGQVLPIKTSFMALGENLFNKDIITLNSYIEYSSGNIKQHDTYVVSDFIRVYAGEQYAYKNIKGQHFAFYTQNKELISSSENNLPNPFVVPANAAYIRLTVDSTERAESAILVNSATIPTEYKPYEEKILLKHIPQLDYSQLPDDIKKINLADLVFTQSKNLFNKETITTNAYISYGNGNSVTGHATYAHTDYIPVRGFEMYTLVDIPLTGHFAYYDENKIFIARENSNSITNPFMPPANAKYVRITITDTTKLDTMMIVEGTEAPQEYYPYGTFIPITAIDLSKLTKDQLSDEFSRVRFDDLDFLESVNLFERNHKDVLLGKYLADGNAMIGTNDRYFVTHYLSVNVGDKFIMTSNRFVHFFDRNKQYISNLNNSNSFTIPEGCQYVRITSHMSDIDRFMWNRGESLKPYSPYEPLIPLSSIQRIVPAKEEVLGYLPKIIYVAKGRTIELYNSQVLVCANINDYVFQWNCSVGNAMKRKFRIDGSKVSTGDYELQLKVYDKYEDVIFEATATIKVVENVIPRKKILCIGDSLTNNKPWYAELDSLSNGNFIFVGTRGNAPYNHEGRSGFTANGYLNATDYTFENEGIHKFWDGNRFNYSWYKTQNNINPDVVQIFLGTNGISLDPTNNANAIKQIIDYIRQDDPNIPIFVVNTLFRANQDGIGLQVNSDGFTASNKGKYKLEEDKKVINLAIRLYELLKDYDNLYFIPIATCHDSEFNFGSVETPVNPRASQTELLPVEATHPQKQGYLQFADIMYSTYCANLK